MNRTASVIIGSKVNKQGLQTEYSNALQIFQHKCSSMKGTRSHCRLKWQRPSIFRISDMTTIRFNRELGNWMAFSHRLKGQWPWFTMMMIIYRFGQSSNHIKILWNRQNVNAVVMCTHLTWKVKQSNLRKENWEIGNRTWLSCIRTPPALQKWLYRRVCHHNLILTALN